MAKNGGGGGSASFRANGNGNGLGSGSGSPTRPWGVTGKARGPFTTDKECYGYDHTKFPEHAKTIQMEPLYGPFKNSSPAKKGYNKTI